MEFNKNVNPKAKTKLFKIYADVSGGSTPEWELQGRGVESWTINENQDIDKKQDVLGLVDMDRGDAQPTQSGITVKLRKDSKFGAMLFDAWLTGDKSKLDAVKILQKFEFVDGDDENTCLARLEEDVMIGIDSWNGEASDYLGFEISIHYSNKRTIGTMPIEDGESITFTPKN